MTAAWRTTATAPTPVLAEDPLHAATYAQLAAIVAAWRYDFDRARAAWDELQARRRVVERCGFDAAAVERYGAPAGPMVPPWWAPPLEAGPRTARWQRPESSSCYLSETDEARAELAEAARQFWTKAAGVPRER